MRPLVPNQGGRTVVSLKDQHKATIMDAAQRLTGFHRRAFQAKVAIDYLNGSVFKAEKLFGWCRHTVQLGLNERRTGIRCIENFSARGNKKIEEKNPKLEQDIRALAEPESQADPKFQSTFSFTRMSARAMRQALIDQKGWSKEALPTENSIGSMMNRMGYKLRRVQKVKPLKKVAKTDEIFEKIKHINQTSDAQKEVLRISIDTKAKVNIGEFSRGGMSRGQTAVEALDHDTQVKKN